MRVAVFVPAVFLLVQVWRTKYMMILSRRNIFIIMGVVFVAMLGVCMGLQIAAPQVYGYVTSYPHHDCVAIRLYFRGRVMLCCQELVRS